MPTLSSKKSPNFLQKLKKTFSRIKPVYTPKAPEPVGPYSQAVKILLHGARLLVCSGQIPLDPETSQIVGSDVEKQTEQVFQNVQAVLSAEKMRWEDVIKTTVFLTDMDSFHSFNEIYSSYFKDHKPARSCVEVSALPKGSLVEMEVWAIK
ncbi:MAG: RidA family protein [Bdellovibrionales bacterium]|nr:RidA family protein [Bdellovibrionales bacterium]